MQNNVNKEPEQSFSSFVLTDSLAKAEPFVQLITKYECALIAVETKLNVLSKDFAIKNSRNPFEAIKSRIKKTKSIINKMNRLGIEPTLENIESALHDIAGARVICSFIDDIYKLANALIIQDDIILIEKKDYIKNPKPNGYKSLHLIIKVPVYLSTGKEDVKVEVQFRTIAMDFWASLEHKLRYKKDIAAANYISRELREVADLISNCDEKMQNIRKEIDILSNL